MPRSRTLRALALAVPSLLGWSLPASAQITLLGFFDPAEIGSPCGVGYDLDTTAWVYECFGASLHRYAPDGTLLGTIPRPGESANDVDVEVAPEALTLGTTSLPAGTLLFINGESGPAEIYALDKTTGAVLATLSTAFGVGHVVGGAYNPARNTFFLVQDNVPGSGDGNLIAEVDPVTGAVLNTFQITASFSVNFGDVEVADATGNLLVVSSDESDMAEFTPDGTFVQYQDLPPEVSGLSGIGLDCAAREAWVAGGNGRIFRLGDMPCGVGCPLSFNTATITPLTLDPGDPFTVSVNVANAGPGPRQARLVLDYDRIGPGPSGSLTLGQGTIPQTSGVSASVTRRVPGNAPAGSYDLDLNLVEASSGTVCDTRPFTMTVQAPPGAAPGHDLFEAAPEADLFGPAATAGARTVRVSPNPAAAQATFRFTLDAPADVRLAVYDALGREVAVVVAGALPAGSHAASPDASALPPGVYVYRLVVDGAPEAGRFTVAR
ncbi:MAG TPA: T9SS type A sorting domain-containing protein [Rubricoccaceae bacterium]|nr:T9SS type A sorting domain-containing protein [Rubricoccaceae bacterium]